MAILSDLINLILIGFHDDDSTKQQQLVDRASLQQLFYSFPIKEVPMSGYYRLEAKRGLCRILRLGKRIRRKSVLSIRSLKLCTVQYSYYAQVS